MSEFATLHPYDPAFVQRYVAVVRGDAPAAGLLPHAPGWAAHEIARAQRGPRARAGGRGSGRQHPQSRTGATVGRHDAGLLRARPGLTQLEARFDRGIGMLLRPPSRLFADAGLETVAARRMPIRLDASGGSMGGAVLPPNQVAQFRARLETSLERLARRMAEAEMDAPAYVGPPPGGRPLRR